MPGSDAKDVENLVAHVQVMVIKSVLNLHASAAISAGGAGRWSAAARLPGAAGRAAPHPAEPGPRRCLPEGGCVRGAPLRDLRLQDGDLQESLCLSLPKRRQYLHVSLQRAVPQPRSNLIILVTSCSRLIFLAVVLITFRAPE